MKPAPSRVDDALVALVEGRGDDPFAVLGRHTISVQGHTAQVFRTLQPGVTGVDLLLDGRVVPMVQHHDALFEVIVPVEAGDALTPAYRFRLHDGYRQREIDDPYRFGQLLRDFDLHLFSEGTHYRAWEQLGSHQRVVAGISGVHFAVWAPNAQRVSVIGDFNRWDGRVHGMRRLVP